MTGMTPILSEIDLKLNQSEEFGLSTCDRWADGNGVCYSSYHRPIVNMRPKYRTSSMNIAWGLPADLSIIAWLDNQEYDYDVLTDEDLHREGRAALAPYKCIIGGTHPECYSEPMLDATEDYIAGGGRYIYLGANGFHWSVAFRDDEPWVMECRKFGPAWKTWEARPGEYYMTTTGHKGGAWRAQGRPAQKLVGVGFISEGYGESRFFAGCRTAITAPYPGLRRESKGRSSATSALPMTERPAWRSTDVTSRWDSAAYQIDRLLRRAHGQLHREPGGHSLSL